MKLNSVKEIKSGNDIVYVQENFLSEEQCDEYFKKIKDIGYVKEVLPWNTRVVKITKDPIVEKVTKFINKQFNLNLIVHEAEIQNHHVNSFSPLHIHEDNGRENIIYNSLIYLNDNFDGGQFFTKNGISIKPKKGMFTFFNGQTVYHGVKRILKNDRKTLIFWWK